jgi:hypothetical protein
VGDKIIEALKSELVTEAFVIDWKSCLKNHEEGEETYRHMLQEETLHRPSIYVGSNLLKRKFLLGMSGG